ncbi:hypothetical protein F4780DRAFT_215930 [Xylariomycetidae sp. FL0641]|nr:hypothetical protein F4780DRAFT_215930 [Xylariomycetidae sp. FL0641]
MSEPRAVPSASAPPVPGSSSSGAETAGGPSSASPAVRDRAPPLSSPSSPPSTWRAAASSSAAPTASTTPPTTTRTIPTNMGGGHNNSNNNHHGAALQATLPSPSTQLHIAEARAALVASMSNMLDSELQSRAGLLHSNAAALARQERDVARATEGLRRENDKLAKAARDAGRQIKELGNVQNWAEVLERDFLVLEETMRLANGDDDGSCSVCSGSSRSSWSGSGSYDSREGSRRGSVDGRRDGETVRDGDGDVAMDAAGTVRPPVSTLPSFKDPVDAAVLESLTEAMATDLGFDLAPGKSLSSPPPSTSETGLDKGKGIALEQDERMELDPLESSFSEPSQTVVSSSASVGVPGSTSSERLHDSDATIGC